MNILNETLNIYYELEHFELNLSDVSDGCKRSCTRCVDAVSMAQSARDFVAAILSNDELVNALANACTSQNLPDNRAQSRTSEEEVRSLFNRGRPVPSTTGQTVFYNPNLTMPSTTQQCLTTTPPYNLRPFTTRGPRRKR